MLFVSCTDAAQTTETQVPQATVSTTAADPVDVPETEITDMCKGITVIDHITYRRIKREISIAVGVDVFWGIDKCYKDDKKKLLIERACKDLKIPFTYDSIEVHTQARE